MKRAFIIGGSGQIGVAVARHLLENGWSVHLGARKPPLAAGDWSFVPLDRNKPNALGAAIGDGADLLLDCIAFDAEHAEHLSAVQSSVGHIVAVSSASVYCDDDGRTLDEASTNGFPVFPVPIPEAHPTVAPSSHTYSTRKVAMEQRLLELVKGPVTILRPAAIHGPHSKHAREYWFVRRLLDGRRTIPVAYGGQSRFQTTSVAAIASAVSWRAEGEGHKTINVSDADAPTVQQIGKTIMDVMGIEAELVDLPDVAHDSVRNPWAVEGPMVCASSAPSAGSYAQTVPAAVHWLVEAAHSGNWKQVLPQFAGYGWDLFDYENEDQVMREHATSDKFVGT